MKIQKLCTLVFALVSTAWFACGEGDKSPPDAPIILSGTGGTIGLDGPVSPPDAPVATAEVSPGTDTGPVEAATTPPASDCTGLTPEQCHDHVINPTVVPPAVLQQDPGPNPAVGYPACSALGV